MAEYFPHVCKCEMTILQDQVIENPLKVRENPVYVPFGRKISYILQGISLI